MIELYERIGMLVLLMDVNTVEDVLVDKYELFIKKNFSLNICFFFFFIIQVRDEYRKDYDPGRGGFGKRYNTSMDMEKNGLIQENIVSYFVYIKNKTD